MNVMYVPFLSTVLLRNDSKCQYGATETTGLNDLDRSDWGAWHA